jgi:hypothetical protein
MSVLRQANILGQQRLDVPHLRAIESSIAADFDLLAGKVMAGDQPLVIKGFDIVTSGAVGNPVTDLQLSVANSVILHPTGSEHGTIFSVPSDAETEVLNSTNPNVEGSFTAGQTNYIGLDLRRTADDETADLVMFLDANTLIETPKSVPLARILNYKIVISTTDFASTPNLLPIAKVTTNVTNTVTALEDARPLAYRLGSGGSVPNRYNTYAWSGGRLENTSGSVFEGGDKALSSMKDWMDAMMTRLWELGGGQYWYSATSDREVKLLFGQPVIAATADNFQWTLGTNTLQWASLSIGFGNSPVAYNTINDGTAVLLDNQCLYVDLDRTSIAALTPQVASLTTLGTPTIPGSRHIIAWRRGNYIFVKDKAFEVGRTIGVANTITFGTVKLKYAAGDPANPTVLAMDTNGAYSNTANGGNASAFYGTGNGSGAGFAGTGGTSNGVGVRGTGGGTGGNGVHGSSTNGYGVYGESASNAVGGISSGNGAGVYGTSSSGHGVYGIAGSSGFGSNAGVYGSGTRIDNYGVIASGYTASSGHSDGGYGAYIIGGTAFSSSLVKTGGTGVFIWGGNGNLTSGDGGNGGLGAEVHGGAGANASFSSSFGGVGGKGMKVFGGAGGNTTSPINAGAGGTGLEVTGGAGGTISGGTQGQGASAIVAVGGQGGGAGAGAGINATGGVGSGGGAVGGIGGVFTGGVGATLPGSGIVTTGGTSSGSMAAAGHGIYAIGGQNDVTTSSFSKSSLTFGPANGGSFYGGAGTLGGDGIQAFARGTNVGRTGIVGVGNNPTAAGIPGGNGIEGHGGTPTGTNANGGYGVRGFGGDKTGTGVAGVGGYFKGGAGGTGLVVDPGSGTSVNAIEVDMPSGNTGVGLRVYANGPVSSNPAVFDQLGSGYGVEFYHSGSGTNPAIEVYGGFGPAAYLENSVSNQPCMDVNNYNNAPAIEAYSGGGVGIDIQGGYLKISAGNPATNYGASNILTAKNICKAWGRIRRTFPGPVTALASGYNFSSFANFAGSCDVFFAVALTDANPCVVIASNDQYYPMSMARFVSNSGFNAVIMTNSYGSGALWNGNEGSDGFSWVAFG